MYKGTTVRMGEEDIVVPSLSLGQLRGGVLDMLKEHDKLFAEDKTLDLLVLRGKIILEAVRRNYPDFDEAKLLDFLDMNNTTQIWLLVLGSSGFTPGEAKAAETSGT